MRYAAVAAGALICGVFSGCANRTGPASAPAGTGTAAPAQTMLTPQNLEELMKKIGPTYKSLLQQLEANDTAQSAKQAQQLAEWFGGVEKFWAQHNHDDAVKWAGQARTHASDAAGAAAAGNAEKASTAANAMAGACKQCHGTYREEDGAGGYRIKAGVIARRPDSAIADPLHQPRAAGSSWPSPLTAAGQLASWSAASRRCCRDHPPSAPLSRDRR